MMWPPTVTFKTYISSSCARDEPEVFYPTPSVTVGHASQYPDKNRMGLQQQAQRMLGTAIERPKLPDPVQAWLVSLASKYTFNERH